jgi:hypothetical protein
MTRFDDCHASSGIERRLTNDESGSIIVLEDGDPRFEPRDDGAEWDWDAEALPGAQRCEYCGALEPLFRLEDGVTACGACVHGRVWDAPPAEGA